MPVNPTYPGVYVQERPSGVRTIVGVGTSIAVFIGQAKNGPMMFPVRCLNYSDYTRNFSEDTTAGQLGYYVKLFFLNGGNDCYVMRIAHGAKGSSVQLENEAGTPVLGLTAKNPGAVGETIRAVVTYGGAQPEVTFNLDLFRWDVQGARRVKQDAESWKNLSMDATSAMFAPAFLGQNSKLVNATDLGVAVGKGFSQSGRSVVHANTGVGFQTAWENLVGTAAVKPTHRFEISVDGKAYVPVSLKNINVGALPAGSIRDDSTTANPSLAKDIKVAIETEFALAGILGTTVDVSFPDGPIPTGGSVTSVLRISSSGSGDVFVRPGATEDLTVALMLGTGQGGLEVGANAARRPAPNGISLKASDYAQLKAFGGLDQQAINQVRLDTVLPDGSHGQTNVAVNLATTAATDKMFTDAMASSPNGNSDGIREKLSLIANAVNAAAAADPTLPWTASVAGTRLSIVPTGGGDNLISSVFRTQPPPDQAALFTNNVAAYTLGGGGFGVGLQVAGNIGNDGTAPAATDYDDAYKVIDKEVDLFNLMALEPDAAVPVQSLYGAASVFCQKRRAVLLMDPPATWTNVQGATDPTTGVNSLRVGLVKDFAALFYPRIVIDNGGTPKTIGAAGAMAGLMGRIDGTRGVWKAPAGTEADLRGVIGLEYRFSDDENGVLNPKAVNTLRVFPEGIVNWGARTMDGDDGFASEYKYIPIRRLALFIEESLYRGLKWVVFEPNDEPLWAQIRLNVGAFMHNLFRQGAFQGQTPRDAYFVKCDKETTTQTDRNLGIVNIVVGFAPLKPAEFVILYLQQMAGQIEV